MLFDLQEYVICIHKVYSFEIHFESPAFSICLANPSPCPFIHNNWQRRTLMTSSSLSTINFYFNLLTDTTTCYFRSDKRFSKAYQKNPNWWCFPLLGEGASLNKNSELPLKVNNVNNVFVFLNIMRPFPANIVTLHLSSNHQRQKSLY